MSTTEGAVLGLVAFGERSGYDPAQLASNSVAHLWTPSQSQIYKTLPRLVGWGLARRREIEQRGYEALREAPARFGSIYPGHVLEHGIVRTRATLAWIEQTAAALPSAPPLSREDRRAVDLVHEHHSEPAS